LCLVCGHMLPRLNIQTAGLFPSLSRIVPPARPVSVEICPLRSGTLVSMVLEELLFSRPVPFPTTLPLFFFQSFNRERQFLIFMPPGFVKLVCSRVRSLSPGVYYSKELCSRDFDDFPIRSSTLCFFRLFKSPHLFQEVLPSPLLFPSCEPPINRVKFWICHPFLARLFCGLVPSLVFTFCVTRALLSFDLSPIRMISPRPRPRRCVRRG